MHPTDLSILQETAFSTHVTPNHTIMSYNAFLSVLFIFLLPFLIITADVL